MAIERKITVTLSDGDRRTLFELDADSSAGDLLIAAGVMIGTALDDNPPTSLPLCDKLRAMSTELYVGGQILNGHSKQDIIDTHQAYAGEGKMPDIVITRNVNMN